MAFLSLGAVCSTPGRADLTIDPIYESSITSDSNATTIESTIQTAINNIDGDIANNVTVTIDFGEMESGLGQSSTYQYDVTYASYLNQLETQQTLSSYDTTALATLPTSTNNPVNGSTMIQTTGALLRALGYSAPPPEGQPDSTITFNASLVDDSVGTPPFGKYSLESVVAHEMDEVLGIGGGGSQLNQVLDGSSSLTTGPVGPLDLYRYSSNGVRSYTTSTGPDPYFSINSGRTNLDYFNQLADGADFGDWGNGTTGSGSGNSPPQVQDAFGTPGSAPGLGAGELTALDVVGWNLTPAGMVLESQGMELPEPSTVFGAFCLLGLIGWRSRRQIRRLGRTLLQ